MHRKYSRRNKILIILLIILICIVLSMTIGILIDNNTFVYIGCILTYAFLFILFKLY